MQKPFALSALMLCFLVAAQFARTDERGVPAKPRLIISTDVAIGLIDTHGGKSLSPVTFKAGGTYGNDSGVSPQDIDDGLALAMALNLAKADALEVLAVVVTYGNATLAAQMMAARQVVYGLKRRGDIPVVAGAAGPVTQVLHARPLNFDGTSSQIWGDRGAFRYACFNRGVALMRKLIGASAEPVSVLAIGPLTDVTCLLTVANQAVLNNIKEVIVVASQLEGESLQINGLVVNDFNFRMDPIAGTLLLQASRNKGVPLRFMTFALTGQTSQKEDLVAFDGDNYPGPPDPTTAAMVSFNWLLAAAEPRNEFWSSIFGTPEGPFDQYAVAASVAPELFDCRSALAYVQQCPYPAWSEDYAVDDDGNPTEEPYNTDGNACVDHGPTHGASLSEVPAQLIVTLDPGNTEVLVRGVTDIDGNIRAPLGGAAPVTVCVDFATAATREQFEALLKTHTW